MNRLLFSITLILQLISGYGQTARYSILNIYRSENPHPNLPITITIENQKPFQLEFDEVLFAQVKIYYTGDIEIHANNGENWPAKKKLYVSPGIQYYLYIKLNDWPYIEEIDKYEARRRFKGIKDTLRIEEDTLKSIASTRVKVDRDKSKKEDEIVKSTGTGFLISNGGLIVTNDHVVEDAKTITVKGVYGDFNRSYQAHVMLHDKSNDIAVLQLDSFQKIKDTIPYNLRNFGVETGEMVFLLGYPMTDILGTEIKLNTGVVSSKSGFQGSYSNFQISAAAQPGNSGSPLFDEYGNLIGIVNAKIEGGEGITYAIKIIYLHSLIESVGYTETIGKNVSQIVIPLKDLVRSYSSFIYLLEIEK